MEFSVDLFYFLMFFCDLLIRRMVPWLVCVEYFDHWIGRRFDCNRSADALKVMGRSCVLFRTYALDGVYSISMCDNHADLK